MRHRTSPRRRGVVLLAVLVVVVLLTLAAYRYNDYMQAEYRAADSAVRATQARAFARSGIHYTAAMLAGDVESTLGGNPWENPGVFEGIPVPTTAKNPREGRFFVLSLRSPDEIAQGGTPYRFGVTDEGGKLNLNALLLLDQGKGDVGLKLLMALPNMTEDVASAIIDWLDSDETPRTGGAENEHYGALDPPYRCKNGPLDSLEELLLVRGVTPQLLFGNDRNRNGVLDEDEDDGTGTLDQGWAAYLTVYSREANVDAQGQARLYLNDSDINALAEKAITALGPDLGNYIVAYRMYGGTAVNTSGGRRAPVGLTGSSRNTVMGQLRTGRSSTRGRTLTKIASLWDLVNSQVNVPSGRTTIPYPSPLNDATQQRQLLPTLLDLCSTTEDTDLVARINVNTAPEAVLNGLIEVAGLKEADIQNIVSRRAAFQEGSSDPLYQTPAWLLTEVNLPVATIKKVEPYITARSRIYRFQVVGMFDGGGPSARLEAVVEANPGRPRIVYWRDLTELGRGFNLAPAP